MDLDLTPAQVELRNRLREALGPADAGRTMGLTATPPGYDAALWGRLMDRGWPVVALPAAVGGGDGSTTHLAVVAGELGRSATPAPLHNGVVLAGFSLLALDALADLRSLVSGTRQYRVCLTEPEGSYRPERVRVSATPRDGRWMLDGVKSYVSHGESADVLLVVARTAAGGADAGPDGHGLSVFAVPGDHPGVERRPMHSIGGDRQCEVTLAAVEVGDALVGPRDEAWPRLRWALDRAVLAVAADMAGAAAAALDAAVERVTARHQWGVPIGSFQAVQHRCADMLIDVTVAHDAVYDAAGTLDRGEDATVPIAAAKALCSEACRRVTAAAHQLFGGEGIFADRVPHLWYRRVKGMASMFGDARHHREVVAHAVIDAAHPR